jgi:L-threonylcarbamoyladenylate synthase
VKLSLVATVLTKDANEAGEFIKRGGITAFPTETVYGLGAYVFDAAAIARVFEAKQRPADNPLIAHVSSIEQIGNLATEVTENAGKFIEAFFPGPLTIVMPKTDAVPSIATANLDTIGVRMPSNDLAHNFITACGVPIVAPSANVSGRPSPTTWQAVLEDLDGRIDCILQGEPTEIGLESSVVDCSDKVPVLLRLGAVSLEQLRSVVPETTVADATLDAAAKSPGLRHQHYAPRAAVILIDPKFEISNLRSAAYIGLEPPKKWFDLERVCPTVEDYAHSLFEFFRECDRRGIETIYCEAVEETGIGAALMDRIRRAAAR